MDLSHMSGIETVTKITLETLALLALKVPVIRLGAVVSMVTTVASGPQYCREQESDWNQCGLVVAEADCS